MSSDTPSPDPIQDIQVRLKPIFGVEPKYYLVALYGLILLGIVFALTILPGLNKPGTLVTVTSTPPGAAVTFGEKHWGTTPLTVFLPEGKGVLTISKPGFQPSSRDYASGNNVVLSLWLPRTDRVEVKLAAVSADSVADRYRTEVGRWSLAIPFSTKYPFPPLFSRFAADAKASGWDQARIQSFLLDLRPAVADPQMYLDYGRALGLWAAEAPVPGTLKDQFDLWMPLIKDSGDRLALWLLANQTKPVWYRETAEPSDWYKARVDGFQSSLKLPATAPQAVPPAVKTPYGTFRGVAAASFLWGSTGTTFSVPGDPPYDLPVPVATQAFWIADREVTQGEFSEFVAANPNWAPAGRDGLMSQGWADGDYLTSEGLAKAGEPVTSVSWYAAQAYVAWLNASKKVPGGKRFVLPDDFQWEAAARAPGGATMVNQGVWEWTASAWYPGQSLVWNSNGGDEASTYARSLKGGIQNPKGSVKPGDRAGWPASGANPGLGFRLALVGTP